MNEVFMTLHFGDLQFHYSVYFVIYLFIGWATIILHARQNFDQPTYDLTQNEPTFIMLPRFFSSQHLYLRGFLLYLTGMTGIYLALSLAGPAIVTGILAVFSKPEISTAPAPIQEDGLVASQWPLVLALTIVGLAPNIAGLRTPELLLRRLSHRVALIPAYARYLAFQMQKSPLENPHYVNFRYPPGIHHRPPPTSDISVDKLWRRACLIFARIKDVADGIVIPESGRPLDDAERAPIQKEVQVFDSKLREIDTRLVDTSLDEEERAALESQVQRLLLRAYLVAACTIIAFRVRDISSEVKKMGFAQVGANPPAIVPILIVFSLLFFVLITLNSTMSTVFVKSAALFVPPSFSLNCLSTSYSVIVYAVSCFTAIGLYRKFQARGAWADSTTWTERFTCFFIVALSAYLVSWLTLTILLFPILASQGLDELAAFSTYRSIPPSVGAMLLCFWLGKNGFNWHDFTRYAITTTVIIASVAAFASLLLSSRADEIYPLMRIAFDAGQGLISGLAVAFLSEITRAYPVDPSFGAGNAEGVSA